ncbi:MAG: glycosyltransferase family 2 protein [Chloroflexota bacterium]
MVLSYELARQTPEAHSVMTPPEHVSSSSQRHEPPSSSEQISADARFAVIVATRNRGRKIAQLVESIQRSDARDFEFVIVDQSTNDESQLALIPYLADPRIRYVRSSQTGLSCARNLGVALTRAPIIAITDDDCIVPSNWLTGIGRPFEEHPRVGVVFCSVRPVPVQEPGITPQIIFSANRLITNVSDVWTSSRTSLCLGAGMAIRRTMLADVGNFDELLGAGAKFGSSEDNDLSWRGLLRGWFTFQCADVSVLHDGHRNLDEVRGLMARDFYGIGGAVAKHLRAGNWQILRFLKTWLIYFGVTLPGRDVLAGRAPRGVGRPFILLRGVLDGLQIPIDRDGLVYWRDPVLVSKDETNTGRGHSLAGAVLNER